MIKVLLNLLKATYYDFKSIFVFQKVRYKITGSCNKCGKCCQDIRFKYQYTEKEFELAKFLYPMYRRFKIRSNTPEEGMILECTLLNEDGTCSVYEKRPAFCRNFPGEYIYFNGVMQEGCGFKVSPEKKFEDYLE